MTGFALGLVVAAAFIHATWNFLAKRVGGGAAFVWLFSAVTAVLYAPFAAAVYLWQQPHIGAAELGFVLGSTLLHLTYFLLLQRGYRTGDLSVVYPLARGTGPMLATAAAILLLGERPTPLALAGAGLIAAGVFFLTGRRHLLRGEGARSAVRYGLLTGSVIAVYTLWDKHAVSALLIPPLLLDYGATVGRTACLAPVAIRRRAEVRAAWQTYRWEVIGVALLNPLSYILVLTALIATPVSYVAPARELSILIGVAMGSRLLAEGDTARRLAAAAAMVAGIVALALG